MIEFATYQALTFDCYGTLIDWETGLNDFWKRWSERHKLDLPAEEWLEAFGQTEARVQSDHPSLAYPEVLKAVLCALAERYQVAADQDLQEQLAKSVSFWNPFPDTAAALKSLQRFYRLAVISNVDNASFSQTHKKLGVSLDLVVTAEDVGAYKPDLRNFREALTRLAAMGIPKDRVLHVAQSLYHDHEPAEHLGLASVWIDRRRGKAGTGAVAQPKGSTQVAAVYDSMASFNKAVEHALESFTMPSSAEHVRLL